MNVLLTRRDREDQYRQRDVGRRIGVLPANPSTPNSPTFGELFRLGKFPADSIVCEEATPQSATGVSESLTPEQATRLVSTVEAESRFGILQLSRSDEITVETAAALGKFRGEMLILGVRSLTPEIAAALAKSERRPTLAGLSEVSPEVQEQLAVTAGTLSLPDVIFRKIREQLQEHNMDRWLGNWYGELANLLYFGIRSKKDHPKKELPRLDDLLRRAADKKILPHVVESLRDSNERLGETLLRGTVISAARLSTGRSQQALADIEPLRVLLNE